jgi:hypothetical protein
MSIPFHVEGGAAAPAEPGFFDFPAIGLPAEVDKQHTRKKEDAAND